MAIDHIVIGYGKSDAGEWCLRMLKKHGPIDDGSKLFAITNPPKEPVELELFIDSELWSTGTLVMAGND